MSGVLINTYMAQYERVLNPHGSITLLAGYTPKSVLLLSKQILLNQYGTGSDARRAIENTLFGKRIGTLEYRFYLAGHAPTGWYIASFVLVDDKSAHDHRDSDRAYYGIRTLGLALAYSF